MMPRKFVGVLLLLLVHAVYGRAQGEVLLRINGEPILLSEFEYYYRKGLKQAPETFLQSFVAYKLKVRYACDAGWDTLPSFRSQLVYYQGKLFRPYATDSVRREENVRQIYERRNVRLQGNDQIRIAHIGKYLSQHADRRTEIAAQEIMDSLYTALRNGADFATLAQRYSDDSESRDNGGLLPWMSVNKLLQEWMTRLGALEKDEISLPFYSPLGIHIVKWVDRRPFMLYENVKEQIADYWDEHEEVHLPDLSAEEKKTMALRVRELHDGLLAAYVTERQRLSELSYREADLQRFFKQHQSDYGWDLPHYRGAVIHCRNKKEASVIKKCLKKRPIAEWNTALAQLPEHVGASKPQIEVGVFRIGTNAYIDKLVFKCGDFRPDPQLPYVFVMGKKLKKAPETYEDVKDRIVRDFLTQRENAWLKELTQKYKVEINQEVLKTVNNNGSN